MGRKPEKSITNSKGHSKGSFLVKISSDQNGTWHGTVTWAEGSVTQRFRSSLELMRLMDEALQKENLISEEKTS